MSLHLQKDLERLKKEILKLGNMVETQIDNAILALKNREMSYVDSVLENEAGINDMEVKIEEDCLKMLALHQPVAGDLRFIVVALKVNNDLERMGDFAKNIAKRAREIMQEEPVAVLPEFLNELPNTIRKMVSQSLDSMVSLNKELALEVIAMDEWVDDVNRDMHSEAKRIIRENPDKAELAICLLSTSRYMERIGDLSTNIAEDVVFMIDGKVIRHAD